MVGCSPGSLLGGLNRAGPGGDVHVRFCCDQRKANAMENTDLSDSIPAAPRVPWIWEVHIVVAGFVVWIGGLALHVWTAHLFFTNWGTFAAIVAFFSPPFAELAAIFLVCFWWGPWFYILAIASLVTAAMSIGLVCKAEDSAKLPRTLAWSVAISMYICVFGFSFFAVRDATTPKIVSESEREEIEEVSCVMCAVLDDCGSLDSETLSGVMEAKDRLRRKIGKYDAMRRGEVRKTVDAYLYARALLERDFRRFIEDGAGANRRFIVSEESRQAFSSLPAKMRLSADADMDVFEDSIQQAFKAPRTSSGNAIEGYNALTERQWRDMREVYEDLLKTPMPSREEFLAGEQGRR